MSQHLGLNISDELADAIARRTAETGDSKTTITTIALEKELGVEKNASLSDRVQLLEAKVKFIEMKLDAS
jgi:hypothetical protein